MLGWAVMVNALTMARHRAAEGLEAAARLAPLPAPPSKDQACLGGIPQAATAFRARAHLHSLHSGALVVTSVAISARFSTGPGWVGPVEIDLHPG